ncbi:MAG TPA: hypothetical protein VJB14_00020 [Planctomycetota bacterium]|nr:hypothetical protein [Planctomycetota bacterium]
MKKAIFCFLLGGCGVLALPALFTLDMLRRAERVIDAHERAVVGEISALRAKHAPWTPAEGPWPLYARALQGATPRIYGRLTWPVDSIRLLRDRNNAGIFYPYEGVTCREELLQEELSIKVAITGPMETGNCSFEEILVSLALAQDLHRAGGFTSADTRLALEERAIFEWRHALRHSILSPDELKSAVRIMDHLERRRPEISDALSAERTMARLRIIRVLRDQRDDHRSLRQYPSWDSLYLWRIVISQTLTSIDTYYREMSTVESVPIQARPLEAHRIDQYLESRGLLPAIRPWPRMIATLYERDMEVRRQWASMRIATALAWFEAEQEQVPTSLEDLVPRYLPQVPKWPQFEAPLSNPNAIFVTPLPDTADEEFWVVRRR